MTETQIDIAEIKQTLKKIQEDVELLKRQQRKEDVYFNTWLDQYNNPDVFSVCKPHNDEYIGGPVAGYCPDYMKGDK
jgi:hypothetical protein